MKIAIIGNGRMGKQLIELSPLFNHEVVAIIDGEKDWTERMNDAKKADVAIEFTTPRSAVNNILKCFELEIPVVCGTTGWDAEFEHVKQICEQKEQCLFTASNFSIGVQLFFRLNSFFARIINQFPEYEIAVEETHHTKKLDKPSGTALHLIKRLIAELERKNDWTMDESPEKNQIPVKSIRTGDVFGIHQVKFSSDYDVIELNHEALGREGFARGALTAAQWIIGKKGVFGMDDLLQF